jgi:hypothetical protein
MIIGTRVKTSDKTKLKRRTVSFKSRYPRITHSMVEKVAPGACISHTINVIPRMDKPIFM